MNAGVRLETLAHRLHSLSIHVLRSVRAEDEHTGLSAPRLSALSVVVFRGPLSMGALAEAEQVKPPTMTRLVHALEADGFVERVPDPSDGRQVRVRVTAKGRRLLERGRARRVAALTARLEPLSDMARSDVDRAMAALEELFGGPSSVRPGGPSG